MFLKKTVIILILVFLSQVIIALPVKAKTFVIEKDNCAFQIEVKIVFDFLDQPSEYEADFLIDKWQQGMDNVWNNDNAQNFAPGCQAHYQFDLQIMEQGKSCYYYPEYHCIEIVSGQYNKRGHIADASLSLANSDYNSFGQWVIRASELNVAHEAGHMMGLNEDYHYEKTNNGNKWINDNYKIGRTQSIMAQTWGSVSAFSEHSRQIINQAGFDIKSLTVNFDSLSLEEADYYSSPAGPRIYTDRISSQKLAGKLIKGVSDSAVYYVDKQGKLRWVSSEKIAQELFGLNWADQIIWFSDSIIFTYQFTDPV